MFIDISHLIAYNPPALHCGVAVADLDGDDRLEFIVARYDGPNRVLRWRSGRLIDVAPPELADPDGPAVAVAAGDFDGDGREELYVLNAEPGARGKRVADRLFDLQAEGSWLDLFSLPVYRPLRNRSDGGSVAVIDRRGVGRYGFFVANTGDPMRLYELGPDGQLVDLAPSLGLARVASARGLLTLPLGSSSPDILCANERGPNLLFRNRGDGSFGECASQLGLDDPQEPSRGVVAFDPGSGSGERFALCWGSSDGLHRIFSPLADGSWHEHATPALAFPSLTRTVLAADFDNDGHDEVFFHNLAEPNRLFRTSSELRLLDAGQALDPHGYGTGAAVCDIDGDGVLELLLARGERGAQPLALFKVPTAAHNNWLRVRPLTRFGAPARGALVRAEANGHIYIKSICAGSGSGCQMEPVAHFGFGPNECPERVQVVWPDGSAIIILNPGINRTLTVAFPRG